MNEILFPRTDAGVAVQAAAVLVVYSLLFLAARRDRDLRLLVIAAACFTFGLFVLRAATDLLLRDETFDDAELPAFAVDDPQTGCVDRQTWSAQHVLERQPVGDLVDRPLHGPDHRLAAGHVLDDDDVPAGS